MLITSRAVLHVSGEHEFVVPPLALPNPAERPPLERLIQYDAVRLFIERAQAVKADFSVTNETAPAIAEICARLDGLPLAIELAAARSKLFAPQALLVRLSSRLKLLTGGARDLPARQQTLRSTIDWSYNLLSVAEQTLFARLAVFVGGCTLEAAEAVCDAAGDLSVDVLDGLAALVDQSLVRREEETGGEPRFTMLETIREYALERLEASGEAARMRRHHAAYCLVLAEQADQGLHGPQQAAWTARLEREQDNLRAALAWSQGTAGSAELGLRLVGALTWFWRIRYYQTEGRRWSQSALAQPGAAQHPAARAKVLNGAGYLTNEQGDMVAALLLQEESLALFRSLGDKRGSAEALAELGATACAQGDYRRAALLCEESVALYQELGDRHGSAWPLSWLATAVWARGEHARSIALREESLARYQEAGDIGGIGLALTHLGNAVFSQGDEVRAEALHREALTLFREVGLTHMIPVVLVRLGRVAYEQGDATRAIALLGESERWFREVGHREQLAYTLYHLARMVYAQGDDAQARALLRECLGLQQHIGHKGAIADSLAGFAALAVRQQRPERAVQLFGAAAALRTASDAPILGVRADYERELAAARAQFDAATFAAAWAAGQAMSLEQAIAYALEGD